VPGHLLAARGGAPGIIETVTGERVLGVDACKAGWIGIVLMRDRAEACFAASIDGLMRLALADGGLDVVAVDMPIGLADTGPRKADLLAKDAIGPLRSAVFMTPVRPALLVPDHATAVAINRELAGQGVSIQAFGLKTKLLEVETWARTTHHRVIEVHPEVSFARMAGVPLTVRKSTWAGAETRRRLLARAGISIEGDLGAAGRMAGVDDVLDAAAAAWSARRFARKEAVSLPDPPEVFSDGIPSAIWA
jgi:predicted RNase H-like nuclease